jgi:hypothetical protein
MLAFIMETALKDTQIPEIWETEEDKKLSTFDLKTKYKIYLQTHFQGKQYCNKDMELWISVSSDCVRQWVKKSRTREKIMLIQVLDFLLENSKYEGPPITDRKNRAEIEHYKHFHQSVFINGKKYSVILKVVKPVNQPHKFYFCSLESTEK